MSEEWTKSKTLKFLKLYSSERILWDVSHEHNKVKRKVLEAWKRISANLDNIQIVELKKRKKNLMTRYRSLVKKKETDSEAGYEYEVLQPVWYAFELMDSFLGSPRREDPLRIESELHKMQTDPEDVIVKKEVEDVENDLDDNKRRNSNSDNESTNTNSHNPDMSNCNSTHNFNTSNNLYEDDNECDLYTRLLAKKLRRYPVEIRHRLMYAIDGLLLENPYPNIG